MNNKIQKSLGLRSTLDIMNNSNLKRALEIQSKIFDLINNSSLTRAIETQRMFNRMNINNLSEALEVKNKVWDQLKGIGWSQILEYTNLESFNNFSSIIDYAAEEYISDNDIDNGDEKDEILSVADNLLNGNPCTEDLSPKQKVFFLNYVYPIILIFFQIIIESIISKPSVINNNNNITNVNNYVNTVNNYYIQEGFSKDFLNDNNLWIVSNGKAIIREKHDCSSKIIGKLPIGKVVCVIGKYKKWVEVSWSDEGEHYNGWIQKYKLTSFK